VAGDYYDRVAGAFDRAATSYDADYAANPIMAWLEEDAFARLCALFPPGSRLFEIGCGTGQMAVRLAEAGREVIASDISPAMIARASAAAEGRSARVRLRWLVAPAGSLAAQLAGEPLDGAYSNFGPLNCEPNLPDLAAGLATLIRPGGALLCSVMGRWCAWEIGWGLLRLRPREATRRLGRGWVQARMSGGPGEAPATIPVRYYTPGGFARAFRPHFRVEEAIAYPLLIPPPYLAGKFPGSAARLAGAERALSGLPGLRALGDHFLLVLRRTKGAAGG
jgi:SAM-dependent methyltransferase